MLVCGCVGGGRPSQVFVPREFHASVRENFSDDDWGEFMDALTGREHNRLRREYGVRVPARVPNHPNHVRRALTYAMGHGLSAPTNATLWSGDSADDDDDSADDSADDEKGERILLKIGSEAGGSGAGAGVGAGVGDSDHESIHDDDRPARRRG